MTVLEKEKIIRAMLCLSKQTWENGISAQALEECGEWEWLKLMVFDMVQRQSADGRLCNVENTPAVTDSAFCIPVVWNYGCRAGDEKYRSAAERNVQYLLKEAERTEDGILYHMRGTTQIWADSAAYLPYSLALTGHYEEAVLQLTGIMDRLYDEKSGLYFHMWEESTRSFIRPLPWGIGNGWILIGILRVIENLPNEPGEMREAKEQLYGKYHALLDTMLSLESTEHGFHDILDDPETFIETETAATVAYAIYRGIRFHHLEEAYLARAEAIRDYILTCETEDGLFVNACSSPDFSRPGTAAECQAHVLMMEEMRDRVLQEDICR